RAQESGQANRVGGPDSDHLISVPQRSDRGRVSARGVQVARDLLVVLQAETGVDDDVVDPLPAGLKRSRDSRCREFRPPARATDAGEHPEAAVRRQIAFPDAFQLLEVETVGTGQPTSRRKAWRLVQKAEGRGNG